MANSFYGLGLDAFLAGSIDYGSDTIKAALVSNGYGPALSTDQFFNIISGGNIVAAGVALTSKTSTLGTVGAANTIWTSVTGSAATYVAIYKDTGTSSTSPLIALFDTGTGLPVTPTGGDITAAWSSGNVFTICQRLTEKEKARYGSRIGQKILDWIEGVLGIPARLGPGGIYLPEPTLIVSPRRVVLA